MDHDDRLMLCDFFGDEGILLKRSKFIDCFYYIYYGHVITIITKSIVVELKNVCKYQNTFISAASNFLSEIENSFDKEN